METFHVIVLGVVQGVTEFLPVSSSGHLVIVRRLLSIPDIQGTSFDAFLHLGTLMAVLVYYWKVWIGIFRGVFITDEEGRDKRQLTAKLAIATLPAAVIGYGLRAEADMFRSVVVVAAGLLVTAVLLLASDWLASRVKSIARANFRDVIYIGFSQVFALFPGVSRSGVTIAAGRWRGLSRTQAVHFSFLMSAPIIAGAGLSSVQLLVRAGSFSMSDLMIGFLASFIAGLVSMHSLLRIVEKVSMRPFAIYLFIVAMLLIVL